MARHQIDAEQLTKSGHGNRDISRYITPNLLALIAAGEGFYSEVSADTQGTQIGFGFNRGANTCKAASTILGRPIGKGSNISYQDAVILSTHMACEKIRQFVGGRIGYDRFDKLTSNARSGVLDTLYNLADKSASVFSKLVSDKIDKGEIASIPALISSFRVMKGTEYEKGLTARRRDAARLAMTPDGAVFTPSKPVYDHSAKKNIPADTIAALIEPSSIAALGYTGNDSGEPVRRNTRPTAPTA